ncbi:sensor domain-containing protein [Desulfovibrio gilichinskyi]|uniref:PAS domain S-box-containing protein/diguanylate cyclase (GGDEF) domain-containing protein n=1 Tax=Desulfovibrio gilichinskyi TaxID=1519643 RepID=A0A1X7C5D1_9BACT|nr:bifunctional diguanylate cyclase/phosphodiesterase [Desulfovibrio gilichinskyi]SME90117.1 PAS domain S-box-containing protein/diguanylate cyclase (GGDEF) domain-containing protein [Desulfovibrio gilichinskyi]
MKNKIHKAAECIKNETDGDTANLLEQSNLIQLFLNSADHTAIIKDTSFRYIAVNKAFLEQSGILNEDKIIGKTIYEVFADRSTKEELDEITKYDRIALALPKGDNLAIELNLPNKDGDERIYSSKRFAIYDEQDQVIGIGSLSMNITDRKITEQDLAKVRKELKEHIVIQEQTLHDANENLQFMSHLFENTLDGVIITDAKGIAQQINPAFTEITGYTLDDIKGKNPRILKSDNHNKKFYKEMWESLTKTGKWDGELWNRRKNGEIYPQRLSITAIYDSNNKITHYLGINNDVSELKRKDDKINFYAYHDALTNLPNRRLFSDRLRTEINRSLKRSAQIALLYIDFDDFKKVNDSLGYHVGDELLKKFAAGIKGIIKETDIFARIGSDEFAIAVVDFGNINSLMVFAKKIRKLLQDPFKIDGHDIFITVSIGISTYPDDSETAETLLQHADTAMHQMKGENGAGSEVRFYTSQMLTRAQNKIDMESAIRKGLASNEFIPFYQAKVDSETGKVVGMEALARWVKSNGEIIPPGEFIEFAEILNLIGDIDNQILNISIKDMAEWKKTGHNDLIVSVNVSSKELEDPLFSNKVIETLGRYELNNNQLEIEITESLIMKNVEEKIKLLETLSATGIRISIDDFGTGYSSLSYLKKLPINTLKIDRSFVNDILSDPNDMAIVSAIISMAGKMGLNVIAEGVEHAEQIELLRAEGCTIIQGFYYSKPLPKAEFLKFLNKRN